ncbi:hypothetical protein CSIV_10425 [Microbacterium sp. CSI-V]|uniref:hypothetical protein n=1 Tax=unclassified Microbacterium TaxID=2609290 RepID=UPI00097BC6D2|nr:MULTISPECIES: hypothetical protein [unclassified Microbacterium]MXS75993.1 hypothetical protein [Microbacterium sp. TL13]ONI65088.1 hypothetical protein CSIV_10425 [Microbacterium sp. CSI-V]
MTSTVEVRRPVPVTVAVVLVYVGGFANTALGVLVLLSRYQVDADDVLPVSLVGAATILLGLLTVAGGSSLARGSRLARTLLTAYLSLLVILQGLALALTELDPTIITALLAALAVIAAIWIPPTARRYFRRAAPPAGEPSPML